MCGIVGFSGSFDQTALLGALQTIAHRGPDDAGTFVGQDSGVALASVRLAIQDVSPLGHQPMASSDGAVVLAFNGEIYNFRELRAELETKGHHFRGHSDTEVLLNLYLAEGQGMLRRLNGIFAFALWDARNRILFVARDQLGVKPLYYATSQRGFAFGSEIKALMAFIPEARDLDVVSIHRYLSFLWCPGEGTPLKAVRKLLPGEAMLVRDGRIERRWTWYQLPAERGVAADLSRGDALEGTVTHLRQAVQRQMVADVPVGAFLSGGLDSSAVVAFARESNPDIRCFTIDTIGGQDPGMTDDLPYARRVAEHLGVKLEVIQVHAGRMASDLQAMVRQLDEPLADPAALNVLYISQLARQHGMKVLLSGAGGDDVFSGYRRHVALRFEPAWGWLPAGFRKTAAKIASSLDQRTPFGRRLNKIMSVAGESGDARLSSYFLWAQELELAKLYTPHVRASLARDRADQPMLDYLAGIPRDTSRLQRMLALEQRFFLADHNLIYTDKMSMAASVEVRVPFLDVDLVEFSARIPDRYKQRGPVGKWVLKKAMEPHLPHDVIYRPKTGFGAPLRRWMRHELRQLVKELLSVESLNRRGLFDPAAVQRLVQANEAGKVDASYILFSLLCIELWCRAFADTSTPQGMRANVGVA